MFQTLKRSWSLTKATFRVIGHDKEILLYPVFSGLFSVLFLLFTIIPIFYILITQNSTQLEITQYLIMFIVYLGLAFIATFFDVATSYTAKTRFEGGNATVSSSFKFVFSKLHVVFLWSILRATVNILFRILESGARNAKGPMKIVTMVLHSLLAIGWRIVTLFVVPSLVYKGLGPINSIKDSIGVLKKTWGESLTIYIGMGAVKMLVNTLLILGLFLGLFIGFMTGSTTLLVVFAILFFISLILSILIFSVADTVFDTALYHYALTGEVPMGYEKHDLDDAFKSNTNNFNNGFIKNNGFNQNNNI